MCCECTSKHTHCDVLQLSDLSIVVRVAWSPRMIFYDEQTARYGYELMWRFYTAFNDRNNIRGDRAQNNTTILSPPLWKTQRAQKSFGRVRFGVDTKSDCRVPLNSHRDWKPDDVSSVVPTKRLVLQKNTVRSRTYDNEAVSWSLHLGIRVYRRLFNVKIRPCTDVRTRVFSSLLCEARSSRRRVYRWDLIRFIRLLYYYCRRCRRCCYYYYYIMCVASTILVTVSNIFYKHLDLVPARSLYPIVWISVIDSAACAWIRCINVFIVCFYNTLEYVYPSMFVLHVSGYFC